MHAVIRRYTWGNTECNLLYGGAGQLKGWGCGDGYGASPDDCRWFTQQFQSSKVRVTMRGHRLSTTHNCFVGLILRILAEISLSRNWTIALKRLWCSLDVYTSHKWFELYAVPILIKYLYLDIWKHTRLSHLCLFKTGCSINGCP
jgi:hypothetical protein